MRLRPGLLLRLAPAQIPKRGCNAASILSDPIGHLVRDVQQLPLQQAKKYNAARQSRWVIGIGGFSYPSFSSCDAINVACGDLAADHIFWASVDYGLLI
jgi:hypothetical protein